MCAVPAVIASAAVTVSAAVADVSLEVVVVACAVEHELNSRPNLASVHGPKALFADVIRGKSHDRVGSSPWTSHAQRSGVLNRSLTHRWRCLSPAHPLVMLRLARLNLRRMVTQKKYQA